MGEREDCCTMDREKALEKIWDKVKRKHFFPEIPPPRIGNCNDRVAITMVEKQIVINDGFCDRLKGKMSDEDVLEGILDHGISHYTYCPWDFYTHLSLYNEARKVIKKSDLAKRATDMFIDVVADTYCVKQKQTTLPALYRHMQKGRTGDLIASIYQTIWGVDMKVRGYEEVTKRLSGIPYLNRKEWGRSIKRFARGLGHILEMEENLEKKDCSTCSMSGRDLQSYSLEEIDQGLKEFALAVSDMGDFQKSVEDYLEDFKERGYFGVGRGAGDGITADILYYMKLAENYSLPLQKLPSKKNGILHPHSHIPWEIGSPIQDIDLWTSFGRIMPGISKIWKKKEGEIQREKEAAPDCLIVIDSSSSMTNPHDHLSYAVLGAGCAVDAYLKSGSKVAVYNFSDARAGGKLILEFNDQRAMIYSALCKYFGGGTAFRLKDLESLLEKGEKPDVFIITDMKISNLEFLVNFLRKIDNRVTAVHIGDNDYTARFKRSLSGRENIRVYPINQKEDIPRIVLGRVGEIIASPRTREKGVQR